jgi:hypothetical protein
VKPIYKDQSILKQIAEIRHEALREQRELICIELSLVEATKLLREVEPASVWTGLDWSTSFEQWLYIESFCQRHFQENKEPQPLIKVMGIDIKVSR